MTDFFVRELIWEHEKYSPRDIQELKTKIEELNVWGWERDYPFLIEAHFADSSHLGFTVSHEYSLIEFGYHENGKHQGPYYLFNPNGEKSKIIPIYYFGSYTEPDTTRMLPLKQILAAVYFYVEHRKFPSFIRFDDEEVNNKYVVLGG